MKRALSIFTTILCATIFAEPVVSDVVAKQRYPWNGLVDITCNVSGMDETTKLQEFAVAAVVPDTGVVRKAWHLWVVRDGVKSTDYEVNSDGNYRLLWDAKADLGEVAYSNMVVRVTTKVGHDKVQLWEGGPYWATTNIGAEEPWEYGYYFWWGDTIGYKREADKWVASDGSSSNYSFSGEPTEGKNYDTLRSEGWITADGVLAPEHDAAHVHWGGDWRMPTKDEFDALNGNCDWIWTTQNGVNGYVVRGRGDYAANSIFLPCAGDGRGASLYDTGSYGYYRSSVPLRGGYSDTYYLYFYSGDHRTSSGRHRYYGRSVRPVQGFADSAGSSVDGVDSAPFLLDTCSEPVVASTIVVTWDASWIGGDENATVVIEDNGTEIVRETGVGEFNHTLSGDGRHDLTYMTYIDGVAQEEIYSAVVFNGSEEPQGISLGDPICWATNSYGWCNLCNGYDWIDCWTDGKDSAVVPIIGATDSDELVPVIVYGSADASMVSDVHIEDESTFKARFSEFPYLEWELEETGRTAPDDIKSFNASRKWLIAKINQRSGSFSPKTFFVGLKGGSEYRKFIIVQEDSDGALEDGYDDASETIVLPLPVDSATISNNGSGVRTVTVDPEDGYIVAAWSDDETNTSTVRELQPGKSPYYVTLESEPVQYDETVQYEYEYDSEFGGIVLTDYSGTVPSCLTLPSEIDGQPVVGIGESFMEECDDIVSLTFPDTIRFIGNGAFSWSANLSSINLNEGLARIGYDVFDGLQSLEELVIPSTVVSIDRDSFNYSGLGGGGIRSISIRGGDNSYFSADGGMLYDKLNRTVITACANIESAVIPSDCTVIGSEAFAGCSALVSVAFPESLTYIGGCVFDGCTSLAEVDLSETCVTEIANGAFLSCTSLTEVKMPATLARVGAYLFGGAKSLSKVVYLGNAPQIDTLFGWSYDDIADNAPYFPNGDMYVDYDGDYDSSYLEWVILDRRLAGVVSYVKKGTEGWGEVPGTWQGCTVSYMSHVVTFDANGGECSEMSREVAKGNPVGELPVPTLEGYEFAGWWTDLECGSEITESTVVGFDDTYYAHWNEKAAEPEEPAGPQLTIESGVLLSVELNGATEVVIPDGVTSIGDSVFSGCSSLTSVTIPDTVTSIGDSAFYNCTSLQQLSIPDSVTSYGVNCFEGCPALYRAIFGSHSGGESPSVTTTIVYQVETPYELTNELQDRAIASVVVNSDCAIDEFVLKDGQVYDTMLYVSNTAENEVTLSLPTGYSYKTIKGARPLSIPAASQCLISITRVAPDVFLVMREELDDVQ